MTFVCAHLARIRSWIVTFLSVAKFIKLEHFVIRFFLAFNWIRMQLFNSFLQTSFSRPPNCLIDFNRTHGSARFLVKERGKMKGVLVAIDPHATAAGGGPSTWCSRPFPASSTATGLHRAMPPRPNGHPSLRGLQRAVTDAMALKADLVARGDRVASTADQLHINFRLEALLGRLRLLQFIMLTFCITATRGAKFRRDEC